jgi:stalled ribosome rescue protein Dom34
MRSEHIIILIKYFGEGAKDLLKDYGIEITYDNKDMAAGKKSNSISNEVLHEILEKINDIKIRLNP